MRQLNSPYFSSNAEIYSGQAVSWTRQHLSAIPKPPRWVYLRAVCPFPHQFVPGTRNKSITSRFLLQGHDLSLLPCLALTASYWTESFGGNFDNKYLTNVCQEFCHSFYRHTQGCNPVLLPYKSICKSFRYVHSLSYHFVVTAGHESLYCETYPQLCGLEKTGDNEFWGVAWFQVIRTDYPLIFWKKRRKELEQTSQQKVRKYTF